MRSFFLLAAAVFLAHGQSAETSEPLLFRTGISLVTVDAKITDRDGRDIPDFTQADFIVLDEDEPQKLMNFGKESTPIEVLLVLDVSPSMRPSLSAMNVTAGEALRQLRSGDRAGLFLFATKSSLVQPMTAEVATIPRLIANSIFKDTLGRATLVNEALVEAANYLKSTPVVGRRTIILVTDNEGARAAARDDEVVRALHGADAVLNAILVGATDASTRLAARYQNPSSGQPDVVRFAKATGGDVATGEDPGTAFRNMIKRATTRYTLQYQAPGGEPGSFRKLRVELTPDARKAHPGAVVQARSGYEVAK